MLMVGRPYSDEAHAVRWEVLEARRHLRRGAPSTRPSPSLDLGDLADLAAAVPAGSTVPDFYAGSDILLTGGSGFLGRLVIELLLRACPDVGNIYLIIRAKRGATPQARLQATLDDPLFDRLRSEQPNALDKLRAVGGDIAEPRLGMDDEDYAMVCSRVSMVFHVAATVRFNEAITKAVVTNMRSTLEAIELAKKLPRLKIFVHMSTAYIRVYEPTLEEVLYPTPLDWRIILKAVETLPDPENLVLLTDKLLEGQPNTYTFTKALSEQIVNDLASDIPAVIIRPSIVVGTFQDPLPGWIDNLSGFSAFWAMFFKGILRCHYTDPRTVNNLVPGDLVAKATVLAAWVKGLGGNIGVRRGKDVEVVNSVVLASLGSRLTDMSICFKLMKELVFPGSLRSPVLILTSSRIYYALAHFYHHLLFGALLDLLAKIVGQKPRLLEIYRKLVIGSEAVKVFQRDFFFEDKNQWRLQSVLPPSDEHNFCVVNFLQVKDDYQKFKNWAINTVNGISKYALKEEIYPEKNRAEIARLYWIEVAVTIVLVMLVIFVSYHIAF